MKVVLIRAVICAAIILLPIMLLMTQKTENLLYLIFPFLLGVPAMVLVAVVFVPVEYGLEAMGATGWKVLAVPLVGGLVFASALLVWRFSMGSMSAEMKAMLVPGLLMNFGLGAVLGLIWRLSDWVYGRFF